MFSFGGGGGGSASSNEDTALVHAMLVMGLQDGVRRVVQAAISKRQRRIQGEIDLDEELLDNSTEVKALLDILELILWHGLRTQSRRKKQTRPRQNSTSSPDTYHFWEFVLLLERVDPSAFGGTIMLVRANSHCATRVGLCRAWIQMLLNQNALEFTIRALCRLAASSGSDYYEDWGFLRWSTETNRTLFFSLLGLLNNVGFMLKVAGEHLDRPPPEGPANYITMNSLVCTITVESALAAACSESSDDPPSVLVASSVDPPATGRYIFLQQGLYGNKITGYQLRFNAKSQDQNALWAIYPPKESQYRYFAKATADGLVPCNDWEVAEYAKADFDKPPKLVQMLHSQSIRARIHPGKTKVKWGNLLRSEVQAIRVEVLQLKHVRENLDKVRKIAINEETDTTAAANTDESIETHTNERKLQPSLEEINQRTDDPQPSLKEAPSREEDPRPNSEEAAISEGEPQPSLEIASSSPPVPPEASRVATESLVYISQCDNNTPSQTILPSSGLPKEEDAEGIINEIGSTSVEAEMPCESPSISDKLINTTTSLDDGSLSDRNSTMFHEGKQNTAVIETVKTLSNLHEEPFVCSVNSEADTSKTDHAEIDKYDSTVKSSQTTIEQSSSLDGEYASDILHASSRAELTSSPAEESSVCDDTHETTISDEQTIRAANLRIPLTDEAECAAETAIGIGANFKNEKPSADKVENQSNSDITTHGVMKNSTSMMSEAAVDRISASVVDQAVGDLHDVQSEKSITEVIMNDEDTDSESADEGGTSQPESAVNPHCVTHNEDLVCGDEHDNGKINTISTEGDVAGNKKVEIIRDSGSNDVVELSVTRKETSGAARVRFEDLSEDKKSDSLLHASSAVPSSNTASEFLECQVVNLDNTSPKLLDVELHSEQVKASDLSSTIEEEEVPSSNKRSVNYGSGNPTISSIDVDANTHSSDDERANFDSKMGLKKETDTLKAVPGDLTMTGVSSNTFESEVEEVDKETSVVVKYVEMPDNNIRCVNDDGAEAAQELSDRSPEEISIKRALSEHPMVNSDASSADNISTSEQSDYEELEDTSGIAKETLETVQSSQDGSEVNLADIHLGKNPDDGKVTKDEDEANIFLAASDQQTSFLNHWSTASGESAGSKEPRGSGVGTFLSRVESESSSNDGNHFGTVRSLNISTPSLNLSTFGSTESSDIQGQSQEGDSTISRIDQETMEQDDTPTASVETSSEPRNSPSIGKDDLDSNPDISSREADGSEVEDDIPSDHDEALATSSEHDPDYADDTANSQIYDEVSQSSSHIDAHESLSLESRLNDFSSRRGHVEFQNIGHMLARTEEEESSYASGHGYEGDSVSHVAPDALSITSYIGFDGESNSYVPPDGLSIASYSGLEAESSSHAALDALSTTSYSGIEGESSSHAHPDTLSGRGLSMASSVSSSSSASSNSTKTFMSNPRRKGNIRVTMARIEDGETQLDSSLDILDMFNTTSGRKRRSSRPVVMHTSQIGLAAQHGAAAIQRDSELLLNTSHIVSVQSDSSDDDFTTPGDLDKSSQGEETEEERMTRYAREEEESLAAFIAEQEAEHAKRLSSQSQSSEEGAKKYNASRAKEASEEDGGLHAPQVTREAYEKLVRSYICEDPDSKTGRELAHQIYDIAGYEIGPRVLLHDNDRTSKHKGAATQAQDETSHAQTNDPSSEGKPRHGKKDDSSRRGIFSLLPGRLSLWGDTSGSSSISETQEFAPSLNTVRTSRTGVISEGGAESSGEDDDDVSIDIEISSNANLTRVESAGVVGHYISKQSSDMHVRFVIRVHLRKIARIGGSDHDNIGIVDASSWNSSDNDASILQESNVPSSPQSLSTPTSRSAIFTIHRRFNDFKKFRAALVVAAADAALEPDLIPALPKTGWLRSFAEDYITRKRIALDDFLQDVMTLDFADIAAREHPVIIDFLTRGTIVPWDDSGVAMDSVVDPLSRLARAKHGFHIALITEPRGDPHVLETRDSTGLAEQDFRCISCGKDISIALGRTSGLLRTMQNPAHRSARYCHYTERWFCPHCFHWGNDGADDEDDLGLDEDEDTEQPLHMQNRPEFRRFLPTRVLHHWDFEEYTVSKEAADFLDNINQHPVLCISAESPQLFGEVKDLQHARLLRLQLVHARETLEKCPNRRSSMEFTVPVLRTREHLASETEMYAINDLFELNIGSLIPLLMRAVEQAAKHITMDCTYCKSQSEVCAVCKDEEDLLYAFQIMKAVHCRGCRHLFHRTCFVELGGEDNCPVCHRA